MATRTSGALQVALSESRTRTALLLESIALRHQIAVLERRRTCRPCLRRLDRLLPILLSRWWPLWGESLVIVHSGTVVRWRRNDWSAIWGYRSRSYRRGNRPRVSDEVGGLIARMTCETFLWGVRRSHGEPPMLGVILPQWGWDSIMESVSRMA